LAPATREKHFSIPEEGGRAKAADRGHAAGGLPGAGRRIIQFSARQKAVPDPPGDENSSVGEKDGVRRMARRGQKPVELKVNGPLAMAALAIVAVRSNDNALRAVGILTPVFTDCASIPSS